MRANTFEMVQDAEGRQMILDEIGRISFARAIKFTSRAALQSVKPTRKETPTGFASVRLCDG